jgi:hypothetical protein
MLNSLSEQIRKCYMHAEHCARQAGVQTDPKLKDDFLEMEQRWLLLARSYAFTERLSDFSDETKRRAAPWNPPSRRRVHITMIRAQVSPAK